MMLMQNGKPIAHAKRDRNFVLDFVEWNTQTGSGIHKKWDPYRVRHRVNRK